MSQNGQRAAAIGWALAAILAGQAAYGETMDKQTTGRREDFHLYLLVGQSNMAGRGKVAAEDRKAHPRVVALNKAGRWVPATDPIHFDKRFAGVGPGLTFGKTMAERDTSVRVGLIPCAVGGTSINKWLPGVRDPVTKSHPYDDAIRRAKLARAHGVLKGILWHQGEGDQAPEDAKAYPKRLLDLVKRLRKDLGAPDVPFVAGELGEFLDERRHGVNDAMKRAMLALRHTAWVSSAGLKHKGDKVHFSATGARELGRRYAHAIAVLQQPGTEVKLWPDKMPGAKTPSPKETYINERHRHVSAPTLTIFPPPADRANGTAVIICPGGGYGHVTTVKEGYKVARWLNAAGVTGVVLKYRLNDYGHPAPLQDAQRAIRTVRSRAKALGVGPGRIGILGFSAGGHLASTTGTHFDAGRGGAADPIERVSSRPDFMILVYPVISLLDGVGHGGSRKNLLGGNPDPKLVTLLSNELHVTARTPPTFLVHAKNDGVKVANSILFHQALQKAGVPAELVLFETGGHGFGLGVNGGAPAAWPARCEQWLAKQGLLTPR